MLDRRCVLKAGAAFSALGDLVRFARADPLAFAPAPEARRTYELRTSFAIASGGGPAQIWMPAPAIDGADWNQPLGTRSGAGGVRFDRLEAKDFRYRIEAREIGT